MAVYRIFLSNTFFGFSGFAKEVTPCFNFSTSFSNDDLSAFQTSSKEARLLRNKMLSLKSRFHNYNRLDLGTFTYCIRRKSKSFESQAPSLFTDKSL